MEIFLNCPEEKDSNQMSNIIIINTYRSYRYETTLLFPLGCPRKFHINSILTTGLGGSKHAMILGVLFSDALYKIMKLENGTPFKSYYYLSKAAELFIHFPFPVVDGFKLIEKTLHIVKLDHLPM